MYISNGINGNGHDENKDFELQEYNLPIRRPVVLHNQDTFKQAALAMQRNNIGSVLIFDKDKGVSSLMTDRDMAMALTIHDCRPDDPISDFKAKPLISLSEKAVVADVVETMKKYKIRRVPIFKETDSIGYCVGLVTLDDLVREGYVEKEDQIAIIGPQIKPVMNKMGKSRVGHLFRSQDRREHSYHRFIKNIKESIGLSTSQTRNFTLHTLGFFLLRVTPETGRKFISQLPQEIQKDLSSLVSEVDRSLTVDVLISEIGHRYNLNKEESVEALRNFFKALRKTVSDGEIKNLQSQVPRDTQYLFY